MESKTMLIKVKYEREITVEVFMESRRDDATEAEAMTADEFTSLRDTNEGLYDQILDEAYLKAAEVIADHPKSCYYTFVEAIDR